jgi:hypothetical protein
MHLQHETASSDIDEAGLVTRAKAMDEGAWDYLLQSYYGRMQVYLWNRIGDRAAAEDLASQVFEEAVVRIKDYECRGLPLSEVLHGQPKLFPPMTVRMIEVGEKSGKLDHMVGRVASFYEKSVTTTLGNLSSVLEPVLLLLIGLTVGFVAVAVLTPIWKFSETV